MGPRPSSRPRIGRGRRAARAAAARDRPTLDRVGLRIVRGLALDRRLDRVKKCAARPIGCRRSRSGDWPGSRRFRLAKDARISFATLVASNDQRQRPGRGLRWSRGDLEGNATRSGPRPRPRPARRRMWERGRRSGRIRPRRRPDLPGPGVAGDPPRLAGRRGLGRPCRGLALSLSRGAGEQVASRLSFSLFAHAMAAP
jgi:hypothetical protein